MPRADGTTGTLPGGSTCGCGCGSMTVGDSTAHETCGCGCGSAEVAPKTAAEEAAELRAMREAIDRRLEELAS